MTKTIAKTTNELKATTVLYAVIYNRVSSTAQVVRGHGLDSQESRCRDYAQSKGYVVEAVFPDDVTGGGDFMKRPGMVALLAYLDAQPPHKQYVVIFDDLKRFARDTEFHIKLRKEFAARNAKVECLNFKFEDTPEGGFIEHILAAHGQLEREQNKRQTIQKMTERLKKGYYVFNAPIGYKYEDQPAHGKILVPDEPLAFIIQQALEGFASGRYGSQAEVKRFFESQPLFPKNKHGSVTQQRVTDILTNPIYAGLLGNEKWNLKNIPGHHQPLISIQTFDKIQELRESVAKVPARKNISEDFPLRGFVICGDCGHPMTACWSQGKLKKYPYYLCDHKPCISYRKSIRKEKLEGDFETLITTLQPSKKLFTVAKALFKRAWDEKSSQTQNMIKHLKGELKKVEDKIAKLLTRLIETDNASVISAYEDQIAKLEKEKLILQEKLDQKPVTRKDFDRHLEHALNFLREPQKLWYSGQLALQRVFLKLTFADRLAYCRQNGPRTPKTTLPFNILKEITMHDDKMVQMKGRK